MFLFQIAITIKQTLQVSQRLSSSFSLFELEAESAVAHIIQAEQPCLTQIYSGVISVDSGVLLLVPSLKMPLQLLPVEK